MNVKLLEMESTNILTHSDPFLKALGIRLNISYTKKVVFFLLLSFSFLFIFIKFVVFRLDEDDLLICFNQNGDVQPSCYSLYGLILIFYHIFKLFIMDLLPLI